MRKQYLKKKISCFLKLLYIFFEKKSKKNAVPTRLTAGGEGESQSERWKTDRHGEGWEVCASDVRI
jgi:hypothetical protein